MLKATKLDRVPVTIDNVKAAVLEVYNHLGFGFSEAIYHQSLLTELRNRDVPYETEKIVPVFYNGSGVGHVRLDIVVDGRFVVELKSLQRLRPCDHVQLKNYLKIMPAAEKGLLVNFGGSDVLEVIVVEK